MPKKLTKTRTRRLLQPVGSEIGYQRGHSFYMRSHGGSGGKFHAAGGKDGASKCGKARLLDDHSRRMLEAIPPVLWCKACFPNTKLRHGGEKE